MNRQVPSRFSFSDVEFGEIAGIALREFGLFLDQSKKKLVYSRLSKRLRTLGCASFDEYLEVLKAPENASERQELLSSLTTNVTNFFRENHHFDAFTSEILPEIAARAKQGARIRLWSAACSAGQEPYSLAMSVLRSFPDAAKFDFRILATDIDLKIVQEAISATYPIEQLRQIPDVEQAKFTTKSKDGRSFQIKETVRGLVKFGTVNLIKPWPFSGSFDLIMCRNVAIYFNQDTQHQLWSSFARVLVPGGVLQIGHSERVSGPALSALTAKGITSYQKRKVN